MLCNLFKFISRHTCMAFVVRLISLSQAAYRNNNFVICATCMFYMIYLFIKHSYETFSRKSIFHALARIDSII